MKVSGSIVHPENAISDLQASTFEGVNLEPKPWTHDWWNGSTLSDFMVARKLSERKHQASHARPEAG